MTWTEPSGHPAQRTRRGRLHDGETTGATLTVSSLGAQGAEDVFGVIHPPQGALVGFGAASSGRGPRTARSACIRW
ncbi:2-oxo acid dehydrogenase subunit E2 [Streptomyces sp. NPDC003697]